MNLQLLSFAQLVTFFVTLGPHKRRELALHAGVSPDIVAQWAAGTARPDPMLEPRLKHHLLSKLSNIRQLKIDHDVQLEDLERAKEQVKRVAEAWNIHLRDLHKSKASNEAIREAEDRKAQSMDTLRRRLGLG
jgi:hypothetical protein